MYSLNDDFDIYMSITIVGLGNYLQPGHLKRLVFGRPLKASRFRECQLTPRGKGILKGRDWLVDANGTDLSGFIAILCNA